MGGGAAAKVEGGGPAAGGGGAAAWALAEEDHSPPAPLTWPPPGARIFPPQGSRAVQKPIPIDLQIALAHAARGNFMNVIEYYSAIGRKEAAGVFLRRNGRFSSAARMFHEAAVEREAKARLREAEGRRREAERLRRQARRLKLKAIGLVFRVAELGDIRDARFFWDKVGEAELVGRLADEVIGAVREKHRQGRLTLEEVQDAAYLLKMDGRRSLQVELRRLRRELLQKKAAEE